jgi:hypothetical protein
LARVSSFEATLDRPCPANSARVSRKLAISDRRFLNSFSTSDRWANFASRSFAVRAPPFAFSRHCPRSRLI